MSTYLAGVLHKELKLKLDNKINIKINNIYITIVKKVAKN
jgi:hypothetical protein